MAEIDRRREEPLVSVVIPTWKRPRLLGRAVASVGSQTYRNWELIVVDDNEPDGVHRRETRHFMARFESDERIRYIEHDRNRGGAAARNTGIRASRGELVAFLDDDDEWHPGKLERQVAWLLRAPEDVAMVYAGCRTLFEETGRVVEQLPVAGADSERELLVRNTIGTTSLVMCRKGPLSDVGMFDEELPSRQDVDLYLRLAQQYRMVAVPEVLVTHYRHSGESIGKNVAGSIEAHRHFLSKHYDRITRYPEAHARRCLEFGKLLFENGSLAEARGQFGMAASLNPPCWEAVGRWALANPSGRQLVGTSRLVRARLRLLGRALVHGAPLLAQGAGKPGRADTGGAPGRRAPR